jgi:hypothetical protein
MAEVVGSNPAEPILFPRSFEVRRTQRSSIELATSSDYSGCDCDVNPSQYEIYDRSHSFSKLDAQNTGQTLGTLVLAFTRDRTITAKDCKSGDVVAHRTGTYL